MNATHQTKRSSGPSDPLPRLLESLKRLGEQAAPHAGLESGARSALELCVLELEELLPGLTEFLGTESLLSAGFEQADRQRAEERLAESRSKFRELRALLDSGHGLLQDHETAETGDEPARALMTYLAAAVRETLEAMHSHRTELQRR